MLPNAKWDRRFMELAKMVSTWSKDPSTKCGAVIVRDRRVLSMGYNGFPVGVEDLPSRYANRETKLQFVVHSEANAILSAGRHGVPLVGATLYVWPFLTCHECAKQIIQSGIREVVFAAHGSLEVNNRWASAHGVAMEMYREANVTVRPLVMEGEH